MSCAIRARPLTADGFALSGDVIDKAAHRPRVPIDGGRAQRVAALAHPAAFGEGGAVVLSIVESEPCAVPLRLEAVERHPLGSQAVVPLSPAPFLVVVCPDRDGAPGEPRAFVTAPHQGVTAAPACGTAS